MNPENICNVRSPDAFSENTKAVNKQNKKKSDSDGSGTSNDLTLSTIVSLQKNINFMSCLAISIGNIIGSGIFISPKGVLIGSGSIGVSLIVWTLCGLKTLLGSLAYVELGILLPNSGGTYYYQLEAFHPGRKKEKSFWGSLIPFLFFWNHTFFHRPASIAVQGLAVGQYAIQLATLKGCDATLSEENSVAFKKLISIVFIMSITAANCYTNKLSTSLIRIFTIAKLVTITVIIVSGLTMLSLGTNEALKTGFEGTSLDGLLLAFYSGTWAYGGWDRLNYVTRELANPKRDLPLCLVTTCFIITSLYLLVNISYFAVLSKENFLTSDAVAADFADRIIGKAGVTFIIISVIMSIIGGTLATVFTSNRVIYAAAREGHMVELLSFIQHKRMTPTVAISFMGMLAVLLTPCSSILGLISLISIVKSMFLVLSMVALLVLRKRRQRSKDDFRIPLAIIIINMIGDLGLVIIPFIKDPKLEFFIVVIFLFTGVLVYTIFVYYKKNIKGFERVTKIVQKILQVVPPEDDDV